MPEGNPRDGEKGGIPMKIDFHNHYYPEDYLQTLQKADPTVELGLSQSEKEAICCGNTERILKNAELLSRSLLFDEAKTQEVKSF